MGEQNGEHDTQAADAPPGEGRPDVPCAGAPRLQAVRGREPPRFFYDAMRRYGTSLIDDPFHQCRIGA